MATQDRPRIQARVFILFVLIGLLPLAVGSAILINGARQAYQEVMGENLGVVAENARMELNNHLQRTILQVAALGLVPEIREAVLKSNQVRLGREELEASVKEIESKWGGMDSEKPGLARDILSTKASRFLFEQSRFSGFREILVTDAQGRLVAASGKTSDYYQGDERWWQYAYREGVGGRFIGDIQFDYSVNTHGMDFAEAIIDPATQKAAGVVKAVVDCNEIFRLMKSVRVGHEGHVVLVRGDGTILVDPRSTIADGQRFEHLKEVLGALGSGAPAVQAGDKGRQVFLGLPQFALRESYPELDWYLVIQQSRDEALSVFRNINLRFVYVLVFSAVVVLLLSLFFSWVLAKPVIEVDPHLEKL